ncbi:MAG: helix-turn-helix domain-containing protein [Bacteroidota bacterium]
MYLRYGRILRQSFSGLLLTLVLVPTCTHGQSSTSYERLVLPASSAASGGVNGLLLHTTTNDVWLLGETFVGVERSGLLLQLDTLGQLRSGQRWGTPGDQLINAEAIIELGNGDLLVAGNVRENVAGAQQQILLLRFGSDGAFQESHRLGTSSALDLFGDKWTLLIIRDLIFDGKRFYSDFLKSKEGIATNILSDRLKKLEKNGIISVRVYAQHRSKKEYLLTPKGKNIVPILVEMIVWSARYDDGLAVPPVFLQRAKTDREGLIADLIARIG